jgi:hypothetical protein
MSVVKGIPHPSHLRYSEELDRYTEGTPAILLARRTLLLMLMRIFK